MQVNNGNLYWKNKSKINKIYPYLTHDIKADVLVIGGGIAGALTTYFLAKEGANVVTVEKNIIGLEIQLQIQQLLNINLKVKCQSLKRVLEEKMQQGYINFV